MVFSADLAPQAVGFDLDGTIFDLEIDWHSLRQNVAQIAKLPVRGLTEMLQQAPTEAREEILRVITEAEVFGVEQGSPVLNASELLSSLESFFQVGVVSRNSRFAIEAAIKTLGVTVGSQNLIGREDVIHPKPNPEGILLLAERMNVHPSKLVFVGDTFHDVIAAQRAGAFSVILRSPGKEVPEGADTYINSLNELSEIFTRYH